MLDVEAISKLHADHQAMFHALASEIEFSIRAGLASHELDVHSVTSRVKGLPSLLRKLENKSYSNPWLDCEDLVGVRIVCRFLADLDVLDEIVNALFSVVEKDDKAAQQAVDSFGYTSVHYVCTLLESLKGPRYDLIKGIRFELQCRTMLMDAWANVSHHLVYKGNASVPSELRRDFHALSALFYVADRQFQAFAESAAASRSGTESLADSGLIPDDVELNLDTMTAAVAEIFPDHEVAKPYDLSDFVEELGQLGYTTVGELKSVVARAREAALLYEADHPPSFHDKFNRLGIARQAVALGDSRYLIRHYPDDTPLMKFVSFVKP